MAEDFDVEAMLEAPYLATNGTSSHHKIRLEDEEKKRKRSRSRERKERKRSRSRSKERRHKKSSKRSKSRDRSRERRRSRDKRSRSRERHRRRYDDDRSDKHSRRHREDSYSPKRRSPSYHREDRILEEADRRTVFCMQLAARVRPRDLEDFFTRAGKVREVRLIMDNKTRKHKGIAYIEFRESSSVPLALQLNGQKLCGYPITIQPTQAEKNKSAILSGASSNSAVPAQASKKQNNEPLRLYVGSLHFNVNEDMLKSIFEPFGTVTKIELMRDTDTLRSKGYGFITFAESDQAKKALDQLNGYELAGRPMKVNTTTERGPDGVPVSTMSTNQLPTLDSDELDRTGIPVSTTTRLQLMKKLAEGTGIEKYIEQYTNPSQLNRTNNGLVNSSESPEQATSTQCFMLTNMFDPLTENPEENWPETIKEEVLEECRLYGGCTHVFVDSSSQGNVYVKATSIAAAAKCVSVMHGRYFDGKLVTAAYIPISNYYQLFPDSITATTPL